MLNLISDPWIPVLRASGPDIIRPDQMAEPDVLRLNWPRPDLNLACLELLIGLTYLAHPPRGIDDRMVPPGQPALRAAMEPLAPAFNLLGDGPRFLQDYSKLEGDAKPPDMLFIDSAARKTAKDNADLMVRRSRYRRLPLPLAAMALYTLQAFAPQGGSGNRTSMRGGGPMVTLIRPEGQGLWPLIWANVPDGESLAADVLDALPWMRPTVTSEKGQVKVPDDDYDQYPDPEMFFGQPRRLRLVSEGDAVTGVIQWTHGTNYADWTHYLSPYYRSVDGEFLPCHAKPGLFGYCNWRGVILQNDKDRRPQNLHKYMTLFDAAKVNLIVAGWAMRTMNPLDFLWSEQPVFPLSEAGNRMACRMVEAAEQVGYALEVCVRDGLGEGGTGKGAANAAREAFFEGTQNAFETALRRLSADGDADPEGWLDTLRRAALPLFDAAVMPGLADLQVSRREMAVNARKKLVLGFQGYERFAKKIYNALELKLPAKRGKDAA